MSSSTTGKSQPEWRNGPLSVSIGLLYGLVMTFLSLCFSILLYMLMEKNYPRIGLVVVMVALVAFNGSLWTNIVQYITRRIVFDHAGVTFRESRRDKKPQVVKWAEIVKVHQSGSGTAYVHGHDKVLLCFDRYYFFETERLGREIAARSGKPFVKT